SGTGSSESVIADDHLLLQPRRIEATCRGITDSFGLESGIRKHLDRPSEEQTPSLAARRCSRPCCTFGERAGSATVPGPGQLPQAEESRLPGSIPSPRAVWV